MWLFKPALNITEQIADQLGEQIIVGELEGGTRIQEVKIARALSVSRGSVREALLILERRHLITIVPRKGASVNALALSDGRELISLLATLQNQLLYQVLCNRRSKEILAAAENSVAGMEGAARDGDLCLALRHHREFHATLLSAASNYMSGAFEGLLPSSQRLLHRVIQTTDLDLYDFARFHRALQAALEQTDKERLCELVEAFSRRAVGLVETTFAKLAKPALTRKRSGLEARVH